MFDALNGGGKLSCMWAAARVAKRAPARALVIDSMLAREETDLQYNVPRLLREKCDAPL